MTILDGGPEDNGIAQLHVRISKLTSQSKVLE